MAIVYTKPRSYYPPELTMWNNDLFYLESTNNGVSWGPKVNVTNYSTYGDWNDPDFPKRAFADLDAIYTADGCLHIVWVALSYNPYDNLPQVSSYEPSVEHRGLLYHWSSCTSGIAPKLLNDPVNVQTCPPGDPLHSFDRKIAKPSLSVCTAGANTRLYVSYTWYNGNSPLDDCSSGGYANGDLYFQTSTNSGASWGAPQNLSGYILGGAIPTTGTRTNNCAAGSCESEVFASQVPYVNDTLRVLYIGDKDAGHWQGGTSYFAGSPTLDPLLYLRVPCFPASNYAWLWPSWKEFHYPFNGRPLIPLDTFIILKNIGNFASAFTISVTYTSGSGWISFPGGVSGTVPAGLSDTFLVPVRFTGPSTQGLYRATINIAYNNGSGTSTLVVPVDFYDFTSFFLPESKELRTHTLKLNVQQTGRVGGLMDAGTATASNAFNYFVNPLSGYLFDGSLLLGNSAGSLSTLAYWTQQDWQRIGPGRPNVSQGGIGPLFALSNTTVDSTTYPSYRKASGKGCNQDSSLAFDVEWWAPKHPDTADAIIGMFSVYKGSKNPSGSVSGLTIAFATDWDIPSDVFAKNSSGVDASRNMLYQQGTGSGSTRFGAIAAYLPPGASITGGFVLDNPTWVWPHAGLKSDSIWAKMQSISSGSLTAFTDSTTDESSVMVVARNATISGTAHDTIKFAIVFAGQSGAKGTYGTLPDLQKAVDKAKKYICKYISGDYRFCHTGDVDGNGVVNISDVVNLISYVFTGTPVPNPLSAGDVDCNGVVNISDVVYLLGYIFSGVPVPCGGV